MAWRTAKETQSSVKKRSAFLRHRNSGTQRSCPKPDRGGASIRRLAATVAHEINNPLTSILLATEKLAGEGSLRQEMVEEVRSIREAAIRIREVVEKLQKVRSERAKEYLPGIQMLDMNGES